jgi:hypothetical protein
MNAPHVIMNVTVDNTESPSLNVELQNRGGSSIAISAIYLWIAWDKDGREALGFQIRREAVGKKGHISGVSGPVPPVTIGSRNIESWIIEPELVDELFESAQRILIEAQLANGKSVKKAMTSKEVD